MSDFKISKHDSDIAYMIFDSHCRGNHPTVAIDGDVWCNCDPDAPEFEMTEYDVCKKHLMRVILNFEAIEEIYKEMVEIMRDEYWCGCKRILEVHESKEFKI